MRRQRSVITLGEPQERVLLARSRGDEVTRLDAYRGLLAAHQQAQQAAPPPTWRETWQAWRRAVRA